MAVDYHENQFLEQLNRENRYRLDRLKAQNAPVPTNSLAFDRYAYTFNNPTRYNDPSGHCIWDLCILEGIGVVEITIAAMATFATLEAVQPGRPEAFAHSIVDMGDQVSQGIQALFAKGEYIPPGLSEGERNAYREAVHRYKQGYGLGAADNVEKEILDKLAELVKKGFRPGDAADEAPAPPEEDDDYDRDHSRGGR